VKKAHLIPAIVTNALEAHAMERMRANHLGHGIGELDLAARTRIEVGEVAEYFGQQHITADDRKGGRCDFGIWFFDEPLYSHERTILAGDIENSITVRLLARHFLHGHDIAARFPVGVQELGEARRTAVNEVIRQDDGERLLAHEMTGAPDGVTETLRFLLANKTHIAWLGQNSVQPPELVGLSLCEQRVLELKGAVEIVLDRSLAAPCDEDELLDTRSARFIHSILNERAIDDRQQLLRHRLGDGKESCPEASDREDGLTYGFSPRHCPTREVRGDPALTNGVAQSPAESFKTRTLMRRPSNIALLVAIASFAAAGRVHAADTLDLASAHAALARGAIPDAITLYTELLQEGTLTGQPLAIAYRERGIAQQKAGFARHAVADYTNALWLDVLPSQLKAQTYVSRGVAYLELGQLSRADQDFAHAIANDANLAEAYFGRGTVKRLNRMPEAALADYGRALSFNDTRPELVHFSRGLAFEALGKRDAALADYRKAAVIAPGFEAVRAKLAALGEPLPLANGTTPQHADASPTIVTLADAGDLIFAEAQSGEPTGAISSGTGETAPAAEAKDAEAASATEPAPPDSLSAPSGAEISKPPVLRSGSDGPLARRDATKPPGRPTAQPGASVPAGTGEKLQSVAKPAATLEAPSSNAPSASAAAIESRPAKLASIAEPAPLLPGQYFLQVAAYTQKDSADKGLSDFSAKFPEFWNTAHLFIESAAVPGKGTVYRLRAGPFDSANAAETACRTLSAKGQDCLVVPPRRAAQN